MKKITIISLSLLTLLFISLCSYTAIAQDFTAPGKSTSQTSTMLPFDHPIWDTDIDDLCNYFIELGLITTSTHTKIADSSTLCTDTRKYEDECLYIYYWDLKNMNESDPMYALYMEGYENGFIRHPIYFDRFGYTLNAFELRGPFLFQSFEYKRDITAINDAFYNFCKTADESL